MSDLLERLKSAVNTLEAWGNLADAKAVEQVAARIREQCALLDECASVIYAMRQEIQNLGGSLEGVITADELLARLRAQERG